MKNLVFDLMHLRYDFAGSHVVRHLTAKLLKRDRSVPPYAYTVVENKASMRYV
jgi:hypothetical protein